MKAKEGEKGKERSGRREGEEEKGKDGYGEKLRGRRVWREDGDKGRESGLWGDDRGRQWVGWSSREMGEQAVVE